ncbi:hypothetical protein, partial [Helicobacter vulpis]|uniref:hypothetical protein n=1 Tax=Helicobacter vulpis TaxID=2316076 RepID=UPI001F363483
LMPYVFLVFAIGLLTSGLTLLHYIQENTLLKERLHLAHAQLERQNTQIKALELDTQKYQQTKPAQIKTIKERYKDPIDIKKLHTCEQQLNHIQHLLDVFKNH